MARLCSRNTGSNHLQQDSRSWSVSTKLRPLYPRERHGTYSTGKRLRWSSGSVLAYGTQVREFAPGRSRRIFRAKKILSTPSFGGEVKPSVPRRSFTASKRSLNVMCKSAFRQNFQGISRPQFHLPMLGALAWWHAWRRLVAKVGTSNPDRTISLKRLQCVVENKL